MLDQFQKNKPLSELSTFGIGGPARYFIEVHSIEELQNVISYCYKTNLSYHLVGKGSNSLFDDRGYDGLVILNKIDFCAIERCEVSVGAGFSFSLLGVKTARAGLKGLEFASGIPATVGGAIFMNAGANGQETCEHLTEVTFVDEQGRLEILPRSHLSFSYRHSCFQEKKGAIAAAKFILAPDETSRKKQLEIIAYRTKTQPYGDKSCGCVFRNPEGQGAGALIDRCGLKGKAVGGAEVSSLHANFLINRAQAKATEVLELARLVKECVKEQTGVELEMELRIIPFKDDRFSC
ncbi:MAG: UDP-N-acetylmuramate dehydrogenase [Verrucomicrobia bacterium]|nr:UDP-N-acetylmuramate dehydrogenase [Verrucomicrobiota bacterium]